MKYIKKFEEVNLDFKTLDAPSKVTGKLRGDVLIDKLEKGDELLTKNNKAVIIDQVKDEDGYYVEPQEAIDDVTTNGKYDGDKSRDIFADPNGRYRYVLKDEDENEYKINDIVKTVDFGSSGPGRNTMKFEILQAIFLGIKMKDPSVNVTYAYAMEFLKKHSRKNLLKFLNIHTATEPIQQYIDNIEVTYADVNDKNWYATFEKLPNFLYNKAVFQKEDYSIYHISCKETNSPTYALNRKFNELKKEFSFFNDDSNRMEVSKTNMAKYCPADIYIVSRQMHKSIMNAINTADSFEKLTSEIDKFFDKGELIPISLKKVSHKGNFKIITNRAKNKKMPIFQLNSISITKDPLRGIASKIKTDASWSNVDISTTETVTRMMTIDSSNTGGRNNVDGEIDGSASRHGKISFYPFKRILNSTDHYTFDINSFSVLNDRTEETLMQDIFDLHGKILSFKTMIGGVNVIESETKYNSSVNNTKPRLISKLQSLQIVYALGILYNDKRCDIDRIVTDIMSYALSIKTDIFNKTPKYLRVI